jgi:hypothetical protein
MVLARNLSLHKFVLLKRLSKLLNSISLRQQESPRLGLLIDIARCLHEIATAFRDTTVIYVARVPFLKRVTLLRSLLFRFFSRFWRDRGSALCSRYLIRFFPCL